jgi:hypothetical protein
VDWMKIGHRRMTRPEAKKDFDCWDYASLSAVQAELHIADS